MEANLAEHAAHLHRHMPGATVTETDDLLIADSGIDDDTFNIVAAARSAPGRAAARIDATVHTLKAAGRPFSWWVGPASTPSDLSGRLDTVGLGLDRSGAVTPGGPRPRTPSASGGCGVRSGASARPPPRHR